MTIVGSAPVDLEALRAAIRAEYAAVAEHPDQGFHFHTGARLAAILGYPEELLAQLPASAIESMAGTGNPFALGELQPGERVVDCGSGAGVDSLIAARLVAPGGWVIVDMASTNGILVNGVRVTRASLRAGDVLEIGPFTIAVERA